MLYIIFHFTDLILRYLKEIPFLHYLLVWDYSLNFYNFSGVQEDPKKAS